MDGGLLLNFLPDSFLRIFPFKVGPILRQEKGADAIVQGAQGKHPALADLVQRVLVRELQIGHLAGLQQFFGHLLFPHGLQIHQEKA